MNKLEYIECDIYAIRTIDGLPKAHLSAMRREGKSIQYLLDCLSLAF
jgi:hypothetical protein